MSSDQKPPTEPLRLMVSGPKSGAGKSTISLALLGAFLESGQFTADELAYIKPATQGIQQTLTAKFCKSKGIACRHVGPVVFYRGFTQKFLDAADDDIGSKDDNQKQQQRIPTTEEMLDAIQKAVEEIGRGKKLVMVDGVGYPSVGSVVGVSNAAVASAVGASVLIVGREGLGDSVDSFNLCATYFESHGVSVLGILINRVMDNPVILKKTGYVAKYFKRFRPHQKVYGLLTENAKFAVDGDGYAPPGQYSQCFITFGVPNEEMLTVDPCDEKEMALCIDLIVNFLETIGKPKLLELVADCQESQKV